MTSYLVLLDVKKEDRLYEAYRVLGDLVSIGENELIYVSCDTVRYEMPYVVIKLAKPENMEGLEVWIPHALVVLVYGVLPEGKIIGFGTR